MQALSLSTACIANHTNGVVHTSCIHIAYLPAECAGSLKAPTLQCDQMSVAVAACRLWYALIDGAAVATLAGRLLPAVHERWPKGHCDGHRPMVVHEWAACSQGRNACRPKDGSSTDRMKSISTSCSMALAACDATTSHAIAPSRVLTVPTCGRAAAGCCKAVQSGARLARACTLTLIWCRSLHCIALSLHTVASWRRQPCH
jgi:hypothetical protein